MRGRYLGGLALIVSGSVAIQGGNSYALFLIVQGTVAFFVGWALLPGSRSRRMAVVVPAYLGAFAQLAGPQCAPALILPFVAWLVVRQRSRLSYLAVVPLLLVTVALAGSFREVADLAFTTPVSGIALVGSAWLASWLDRTAARSLKAQRRGTPGARIG
ncbi:hypothetical protein B0I08_106223 [Glaciihabitans tibetensis]|uniref:Uncharacterized protein n=2 Tax=Glaciihabitans tibetensis TaxID=1266600 RepID=A0A2T0VBQ8_9MICO|nr:hypothetical protein B0I08_106223 [Glaciihabitans tibetensis]